MGAGRRRGFEHVVGAVDVDVVHQVLVANRIEHEREVHERVRSLRRQQGAHAPVADVHPDELDPC